jgi:ubiquinone/menaquinone biosynthesis C-methylase UbiE
MAACLLYAANRWIAQPLYGWPFLHGHLNDLLLIPAALPLTLGIQKWTGLRSHDLPPMIPEILGHLLAWSLVAELAAPSIFPWAIADPYDVLAYSVGAIFAAAWWNGSAIAERAREALKPAKIAQFDPLASHYDWMELLLAGRKLERCRNALWNEIPFLEDVLLVGEGHGKFLAALVRRNPNARVTYVDASAKMLQVARQRLVRATLPIDHVEFVRAELPAWKPSPQRYDLIVTHFFLDCFPHEQLSAVIKTLKRGARPGACWLISDFQIPPVGLARLRAQIIHRLMYAFFRVVTKLPAAALVSPQPFLRECGFVQVCRAEFDRGLLFAELWKRPRPTLT